jgi:hypothetical protein
MAADASRFPEGTILSGINITTTAAPVGTIVEYQGDLYRSTNATVPTYIQISSAAAGLIKSVGQSSVSANPQVVAIAAAEAGDIVLATLQSDDTGGSLGTILGAGGAAATISLTFAAPPTNNDGIVNYLVFDGTP